LILLLFQHGSCFSPASFNRLGSRAQLLPPFFFAFFSVSFIYFLGARQQGSVHFGVVFSWIIFYGVVEGGKDIVNAVPVL
jgi:hypothetical protein